MRHQINKLKRGSSTKAERKFGEMLKSLHIPFRTKVKIKGREIDFVIGGYAIEIDGHPHSQSKNDMLWAEGYFPIHLYNYQIKDSLIDWLKQVWQQEQV